MTAGELRGPRGVRAALVAFLREWLPIHAEACRVAWALEEDELQVPKSSGDPREDGYFAGEPPAIDRWPLVSVTSGRRTQRTVDQTDDGELEFMSVYPVRLYCWVRAEGREAAQNRRDDLATAVQITALAHTDFGSSGRTRLVPSSVVTDFSSVEPVRGDRFVAGAFVGFDVQVVETLTDRLALPGGQPRDTVSDVTATGSVLPTYEEDVTP